MQYFQWYEFALEYNLASFAAKLEPVIIADPSSNLRYVTSQQLLELPNTMLRLLRVFVPKIGSAPAALGGVPSGSEAAGP